VEAETATDIGPDVEDIEGVSTVGPLVWFDLVTPKSVRFFAPVIREIQRRGRRVWISARGGPGYEEVEALLKQERLPFTSLGEFGGMSLKGKLRCALRRQTGLTPGRRDRRGEVYRRCQSRSDREQQGRRLISKCSCTTIDHNSPAAPGRQ